METGSYSSNPLSIESIIEVENNFLCFNTLKKLQKGTLKECIRKLIYFIVKSNFINEEFIDAFSGVELHLKNIETTEET